MILDTDWPCFVHVSANMNNCTDNVCFDTIYVTFQEIPLLVDSKTKCCRRL